MKTGLGRGLDALINPQVKEEVDKPLTISSNKLKTDDGESLDIIAKIPIELIKPNPFQPRKDFAPEALEELKKSILENGLIQPITVRRSVDKKYELISGERRLRACLEIGYEFIPSYIIKVDTKEAMVALALIENIQREKLNAIEVAQAYKKLMEECNLSQEEIAKRVGKERSTITNSIRLLKLPNTVQQSLIKNEINAGHARALINLPSEKFQNELLKKIINEQLSVRKVENLVKSFIKLSEQPKKEKRPESRDKLEAVSQRDVENKLRNIFGTKVMCKQKKDGAGEVIIEFYSNDELERLFELFEIIEKSSY
ncbi:MAG: ParB/RepB/Spo0J family partition protein [Ignavibacteriae bacterium]|nr:ParB/RepB/Spo0J family partition protein [Ignavibacteriota bacterium]